MTSQTCSLALALTTTLALAACGEDAHSHSEQEVISRVELTLTPMGGGAAATFTVDDPDGDGGQAPTADTVTVLDGTTYAATVRFLNALEDPAEDITIEVADEAAEHQVFFIGTAISSGALVYAYGDQDAGGLPIGLAGTLTAQAGAGDLTVILQHLPPVNGSPVKVAGLAETVAADGIGAIAGDTDASVTFPVAIAAP